jgi:hypothetical protein
VVAIDQNCSADPIKLIKRGDFSSFSQLYNPKKVKFLAKTLSLMSCIALVSSGV